MAQENEDGQERTEQPTEKRRREAKEKGQIPRSRELNTTLVMLAAAAALMMLGDFMGRGLTDVIERNFRLSRETIFDPGAPLRLLQHSIAEGLLVVAPFALIMVVVAIGASVALGGWSFNTQAWMPKLEKLDPLKGLKRMFALRALIELLKSLIKVAIVGAGGVAMLWWHRQDFVALGGESLETGLAHGMALFFRAFFLLSAALVLVAAVDVPYQLWDLRNKLKMTKQEVKDEYKETEGKPEVKGRLRQMQRQIAQGRMLENVPKADVVVTNPTHYAVALKYDQLKMRAPQVVAKGTDLMAARIRELAAEHKVPIFEAPPLARALYYTTDLEREIPAGLYLACAQVLAYIFQLRTAGLHGQWPQRPQPEVPQELVEYLRKRGKPV